LQQVGILSARFKGYEAYTASTLTCLSPLEVAAKAVKLLFKELVKGIKY